MKQTENIVMREVLTAFSARGFMVLPPGGYKTSFAPESRYHGVVWRQNTGAFMDRSGKRFVRFGFPGQPDITGFTNGGKLIAVEVKSEVGVLTEMQKCWAEWFRSFGCVYFVARSYEAAIGALAGYGY